jgi:hypothetical protein
MEDIPRQPESTMIINRFNCSEAEEKDWCPRSHSW